MSTLISSRVNVLIVALISVLAVASGCGKSSGDITLKSGAYSQSGSIGRMAFNQLAAVAPVTSVVEFSFCVTQLKLDAEDGSAIKGEDDNESLEARLGLISPNAGNTVLTWPSKIHIPLDTKIQRIKVEIHKDSDVCGVGYSMRLDAGSGPREVTKDIEMKFAFPSGKDLSDGSSVTVNLAPLLTKLVDAYNQGKFTNELLGAFLEANDTEGDAANE